MIKILLIDAAKIRFSYFCGVKRCFLLLLSLWCALSLSAQHGDVVLCQGFYSPWLEEGWDVSGDEWVVWYLSNTAKAGNKAHEMQMYPDYNFNGVTMLTSPLVALDAYDYIMIQFNQCLEAYDTRHEGVIGIGISSDNENWESIWSDSVTESILQTQCLLTFDMEAWDHKSNHFCFYYAGDGSCVKNWFLDNIIIFADKKDKYGRMEPSDDNGFIASLSKITFFGGRKAKNMFTKQKRSKNKIAKILNRKRR